MCCQPQAEVSDDFVQLASINLVVTLCFDDAAHQNPGLKSRKGSLLSLAVYTSNPEPAFCKTTNC